MLEHMMFKGTRKVGPEEFSRIIQENGGNDNAFTSQDFTAYFENLSADRVQVPLDLESDRMQKPGSKGRGLPYRANGRHGGAEVTHR